MASNPDFVQYIIDQCSGAGDITAKKMMGDYCVYCDGVLFGLVCDNNLFVKPTYPGASKLNKVEMRAPYPGAKDHFFIEDVDDRDALAELVRTTVAALPAAKSRRNPMLAKERHVPLTPDETIPEGLVCSQDLRAFFEQFLGKGFRFKVPFQKWLRENAGKTYRDAIDAYKAGKF